MTLAGGLMPDLQAQAPAEPMHTTPVPAVVLGCCAVNVLRAGIVAALEAATIMLLALPPYSWAKDTASFFVAGTFFFAVPVYCMLPSDGTQLATRVRLLLLLAVLGAACLFHQGTGQAHTLFASDVLLFPSRSVANGIMLQHRGGAWSVDRVLLLNNFLIDGVGRLLGPPGAGADAGGRTACAAAQAGSLLCLVLVFEAIVLR